jgi:serine/threonine-protein kinase
MTRVAAMAIPQHMDRQTFLANVRQSGLLTDQQMGAVAARLPDTSRGRLVARSLVQQGLLTKFQAERLLAGLTSGFVLGQYVILDQLGQGGMGRVFKAEHRTMNRTVALKVLAPHLLKTDRAQEMFQREVRAVARLMHPNIVTAYDANQVGDRHYLVLEYVDGPNLEQLVRAKGPLPVGQACEIIRQIALGLQYAYEQGMVHRDIKPANMLLQPGPRGLVKISDFGLARLMDQPPPVEGGVGTIVTKENTVMGTPDYLSPEQARNLHHADIRSDLYSLGCTFYFILTGRVPFPGGTTLEKLVRHTTEQPTPLEQLRPDLPANIVNVVRRLMAKKPEERQQTPAEVAEEVAPFACGDAGTPTSLPANPFAGLDSSSTPGPVAHSDPLSTDDEAMMIGTLPPGISPTPVSISGISGAVRSGVHRTSGLRTAVGITSATHITQEAEAQQRRRTRLAILIAIGIVGGLLGAAMVLAKVW